MLPVENKTIAFMQVYSAESTWSIFSFSTCSWKFLMWSIKATTLSAAIGPTAWSPAAASSGATWSGMLHWEAFNTKSSDHERRRRATWSVTWSSGNPGMFLHHSTALKSSRAANSQMLSMPIILLGGGGGGGETSVGGETWDERLVGMCW